MSQVSTADILDSLVSSGGHVPSNMGAQLERLRDGTCSAPDPFRARDDAEGQMIWQATILRCLGAFTERPEFSNTIRRRITKEPGYSALEKLQKASGHNQGYIATGILRAYHARSTVSQERGLVEVYAFITKIAPALASPLPDDVVMSFRTGTAKKARSLAADAYGDSLLALQSFTRNWNRIESRKS